MEKKLFLLLLLGLTSAIQSQNIVFPDTNFKAKLLQTNGLDSNGDGEISIAEANSYAYGLSLSNGNITDISGIEHFTNIMSIDCSYNQITSINLSGLANLRNFHCSYNQLTTLTVSNLPMLMSLICDNNLLSTFTVSNLPNLAQLHCQSNQMTSLSISNLSRLDTLYCQYNQLPSLSIINCPNLMWLQCHYNLLASLDLSGLTKLDDIKCDGNLLTTLDCSNQTRLGTIICGNNPLTSLFLKNGRNEMLTLFDTPDLQYICADESQITAIQNQLSTMGLVNCHVNSYCSFTPGGAYYTIQGNSKYDFDNNGCSGTDIAYPNLRFDITNGSVSGNMTANSSGNYSIPVQTGTHTITPILEIPSYFTVSPASVNVTFPGQASPFTQDFCISATGVHPDLEITLIPVNRARPGFDSFYKLILKNKGTYTQSGTATFVFNDAVLDLVSSNPAVSNQSANNLSWNFINLLPFESREIDLIFNLNSPVETPAVNGGDILGFTAAINSAATDETPEDNNLRFMQTVFNSFDPNDKTCLEGTVIAPSEVGKYVHYMIRFENTGTFSAENIIVKDMIDTAKFDVSTLVPVKGSHAFVTNVSAGNKVEFLFENINLSFDDANNDGYVIFKIKTKPTLVTGNTFSNTANIYFDYNAPIVTNTATTEIRSLSNTDFNFSNYMTLYPNPVKNTLNIETKDTLEIHSVSIYNTLGQLLQVVPNAQSVKSIDVSNLASGNYFLKIISDKGTSNTKFIKS